MDLEPTMEAEAVRLLRSHLPAGSGSGELLSVLQDQLALLLDAPSASATVPEELARLREWIATMLADDAPPTPAALQTLARDGGLFYEAKLFAAANNQELSEIANRDFKGLLLAAAEEAKARRFSAGLQQALSAQLENVEIQQAGNLLAQLEGSFHLQIPLFTGANFSTAALAVEPDGQGSEGRKPGKGGYSLLFMLELENFGLTRIDAHVSDKHLRAVFFVDNEESVQVIRQELPGFRETLLALGYSNVQLAAKPLREMPPDKQEKFAAVAAGATASIHLLDMKA
jgi:hypothetical protein